jgi:hypothetical protein
MLTAGVLATAGFTTLAAQVDRPPADDMKALVAEVRALRQAVERSTATASQAQLLLGRVQLQENRLAALGRQYQEARGRSLDAQMARTEIEQQIQLTTAASRAATEAEERQSIEQRLPELKNNLSRAQARAAQEQADEAAAFEALSTEQRRWSDFNERLEALERTIADTTKRP